MSRSSEIEKRTESLLEPIAKKHAVVIYDVEYVREAGEWYLRAFIDREGDESVDIDTCVDVSHDLSDALDEEDYIEDAYTLEVSSPGLGRQLKKDRHLEYSLGEEVDIHLYKPDESGAKVRTGVLRGYDRDGITVEMDGESVTYPRGSISSVRLTLDI